MKDSATRHPALTCKCGRLLDCASQVDDPPATPHPGDVAICSGCAHVYMFSEGLRLVDAPAKVLSDARVIRARQAIRKINARN
jgi:hypothetical protein